jgi:NADH:ubiquinone oxidoreductase subunit 3 (subunit A)
MMPSGWGVYYLLCLSAALALAVPVGLAVFSMLLSRNKRSRMVSKQIGSEAVIKAAQETDSFQLGRRMNVRFFKGLNAALALIVLSLIIIPCAAALRPQVDGDSLGFELLGIIFVVGLAALALLYAARKGDLAWLRAYHSGASPKTSDTEKDVG